MRITTGVEKQPHFILLYGTEGIGKTTFAASFPKSIVLDIERGSRRLKNVARNTSIHSYEDLLDAIKWLASEKHDYQSVVIDSLDHVEPLIWARTCALYRAKNIEEVGGGFQKGYVFALDVWRELIVRLQTLREARGMNVICVAHAKVVAVNDPSQAIPYDKYTLKLHENKQASSSALWKESVEAVLFANYEDVVFKVNKTDKKGKAEGDGVRKLYTTRRAAFDAKNRLGLPAELPLDYAAFSAAVDVGEPDSLEQVIADLREISIRVSSDVLTRIEAAIQKANGDVNELIKIRNHARVIVGGAA